MLALVVSSSGFSVLVLHMEDKKEISLDINTLQEKDLMKMPNMENGSSSMLLHAQLLPLFLDHLLREFKLVII